MVWEREGISYQKELNPSSSSLNKKGVHTILDDEQ